LVTGPLGKTSYNACTAACATRQALDRIAGKWAVLVVDLLGQRRLHHRQAEYLQPLNRQVAGLDHHAVGRAAQRIRPPVPLPAFQSVVPVLASRGIPPGLVFSGGVLWSGIGPRNRLAEPE